MGKFSNEFAGHEKDEEVVQLEGDVGVVESVDIGDGFVVTACEFESVANEEVVTEFVDDVGAVPVVSASKFNRLNAKKNDFV